MSRVQLYIRIIFSVLAIAFTTNLENRGICAAQNFNITPITIQSVYNMNGEKCIIQEAAFSTAESTRKIQEQMEAPFININNASSPLPPGTISNDIPQGGTAATSAFEFEQECSEDDRACTLKLKLKKSLCDNADDENSSTGQHFVKYTNVQATGISAVKILTETGETMKELTGQNLAQSSFYGQPMYYRTSIVQFQYNISNLLQFGFDFIVDACCATMQ